VVDLSCAAALILLAGLADSVNVFGSLLTMSGKGRKPSRREWKENFVKESRVMQKIALIVLSMRFERSDTPRGSGDGPSISSQCLSDAARRIVHLPSGARCGSGGSIYFQWVRQRRDYSRGDSNVGNDTFRASDDDHRVETNG
jgi:hypothetical protein